MARRSVKGTAFIHVDFVLTGVVMTMLGPILPLLSARWSLNDTQAGYLFTAQFATSVIGVLLSGVCMERFGHRWTLLAGLLLMAVGVGSLAQAGWNFGLVAVALFGAGTGLTTPTGNLFISDSNPGNRASALNLLNASWGIGAVGCPFVLAAMQRAGLVPVFFYGLAAGFVLLAVYLSSIRMGEHLTPRQTPATAAVWKSRFVPIIGALFFIYVGTETSVGGWVASYAQRIDSGSSAFWAMTPSFFWGALLIGRALAPLPLRRFRETSVATAGLLLAAVGVTVLLAAKTMAPVVVGASLSGLGLAPVFPITISMMSHWFGEVSARVSGVLFSFANFGGATLPFLVGATSTHFGSLKTGLIVPLVGACVMLMLYLANATPPKTLAAASRPTS
jgi:fucose permease